MFFVRGKSNSSREMPLLASSGVSRLHVCSRRFSSKSGSAIHKAENWTKGGSEGMTRGSKSMYAGKELLFRGGKTTKTFRLGSLGTLQRGKLTSRFLPSLGGFECVCVAEFSWKFQQHKIDFFIRIKMLLLTALVFVEPLNSRMNFPSSSYMEKQH